jgi:hypothetical protein
MIKFKEQVIFDIGTEKFKYMHREDRKEPTKVDIFELNKRLNQTKKTNIYINLKIVFFSLSCVGFFALISLKF